MANSFDQIATAVTSPDMWKQVIAYENVLCPDGKRRKVRVNQAPDTFFSHGGRISAYGKTLSGFVSCLERFDHERDMVFTPTGRHREALGSQSIYLAKIDGEFLKFAVACPTLKVGTAILLEDGTLVRVTQITREHHVKDQIVTRLTEKVTITNDKKSLTITLLI